MPLWGRRRQWHRRMLNLATFHEQTKMYMYIENKYSCKTTEGWIHSSEQQTKDTKLRRLGSHRSPPGAVGRELVSAVVYVPLQCDRTSVFPATLPAAFGLQTKEASRYNRTLPHTTGLPARSPSSLASQCPGHYKHLPSSMQLAKTTWYKKPVLTSFLHKTTSCIKNERDCIEKVGEPQLLLGDCGNSPRSEMLVSTIVYAPLLHRVSEGSNQVL